MYLNRYGTTLCRYMQGTEELSQLGIGNISTVICCHAYSNNTIGTTEIWKPDEPLDKAAGNSRCSSRALYRQFGETRVHAGFFYCMRIG